MKLIIKDVSNIDRFNFNINELYKIWKLFLAKNIYNAISLSLKNNIIWIEEKLYWFFKILNEIDCTDTINEFKKDWQLYDVWIYDDDDKIKKSIQIYKESNKKAEPVILWWWANSTQDMWDFWLSYDFEKDLVHYMYSERQYWFHIRWIEKWEITQRYEELTREEFNLLMKIYFWLYDDEYLKNELEEKEKSWIYDKYKNLKYDDFKDIEESEELLEFIKLKIIRRDTSNAFPELKIEKIYDEKWNDDQKMKYIDEIKKEFWDDVIVEE